MSQIISLSIKGKSLNCSVINIDRTHLVRKGDVLSCDPVTDDYQLEEQARKIVNQSVDNCYHCNQSLPSKKG